MIKVLANALLEFANGEEKVKTSIGFCTLPDWVAETQYYKTAVLYGQINPVEDSSPKAQEEMLKQQENIEALKAEAKALEERLEVVRNKGQKEANALNLEIEELSAKKAELLEEKDVVPKSGAKK